MNCPICNKEYNINGIGRHFKTQHNLSYIEYAKDNGLKTIPPSRQKIIIREVIYFEDSNNICEYGCNKIGQYQLKNKKWCCSKNINSCEGMKIKNGNGVSKALSGRTREDYNYKDGIHPRVGKEPWCKGLTKETDERIKKSSEKISKKLKGRPGHPVSEETRLKLSKNKNGKMGGYRRGSGRGKSGWYGGYWCDSSWELAFVIYNLEHDIKFTRNTKKFPYEFNEKTHNYIPDFIMEDGSYTEIKGYNSDKSDTKHRNFPYKLNVICGWKQNKVYLEYAVNKYGKNYINKYEDRKEKIINEIMNIDIYEIFCEVDYKLLNSLINKKQKQSQLQQRKIYKKNRKKVEIPIIKQQEIDNKINLILESDINFYKYEWVNEAAKIINISPSKVNKWMKRNMLEFYNNNCFIRK